MVEWHLELACLKLMCLRLFLYPDLISGFADFSSPAASAGLSSGFGWFQDFFLVLFLLVCACVCCAVAAILLEYSKGCWEEALAIWSPLPALHNKNRHTSTPVMDDKETGTEEEVGGGGGSWEIERRDRDNKQGQFNENLKCCTSGHWECPG